LTPPVAAGGGKISRGKGLQRENVYSISGGNPFYVNEILAVYSLGVPDNIKDSIMWYTTGWMRKTKHVWEILSVLPPGLS